MKQALVMVVCWLMVVMQMRAENFVVGSLKYTVNKDGKSVTVARNGKKVEIEGVVGGVVSVPSVVTVVQDVTVEGDLIIPAKVTNNGKEYSVTSIWNSAFDSCSGLTSVTIPGSVTSIGDRAFYDCSGLSRVTIPNGVTSIGDEAFRGCSGLSRVTIPNGVTSIGDEAFRDCSGLSRVTIPNGVTSIGWGTFMGCSGLKSVTSYSKVPAKCHDFSRLTISISEGTTEVYKEKWGASNEYVEMEMGE